MNDVKTNHLCAAAPSGTAFQSWKTTTLQLETTNLTYAQITVHVPFTQTTQIHSKRTLVLLQHIFLEFIAGRRGRPRFDPLCLAEKKEKRVKKKKK
jgi:hypothetical protein